VGVLLCVRLADRLRNGAVVLLRHDDSS
jgi:hypothetical protein